MVDVPVVAAVMSILCSMPFARGGRAVPRIMRTNFAQLSSTSCLSPVERSLTFPRRMQKPPWLVRGGWDSPGWNWGYANGEAHDKAAVLRSKLRTQKQRGAWLQELSSKDSEIDWEEVKLALALKWQRAIRERRDQAGWCHVLEEMRLARSKKLESRLEPTSIEDSGESVNACKVAIQALEALDFERKGL
eukprot:jgi/Bigna1/69362/fgenesh1_pg.8_\